MYDFDKLTDRRSTESAKWSAYEADVIPMWVADMDFRSPEPVIDALRARVEHGIFGYPNEVSELSEVIVQRLDNLYRWKVEPEEIIFLPGVVNGFNVACQAFAGAGDGVLVQTPVYPPFLRVSRDSAGSLQEMQLSHGADGNYRINMAHFERAITDRTRVFLMCNPHNPVGRAFDKHELETMASVCLKHKMVICSDEIHCDIVFNGKRHIPIASLDPEISHQTITLMAASKSFNIAGLNCAFAVIQNPEFHQKFCEARKGLVGGVNVLGLVAALSAYKEGQSWLNHLLMYLESNRDFLYNYVNQEMPGISMGLPEATYLAWLDCRKSAIPGNPYQFFLENARVACNDGDHFGSGGKGFVRLNFGCPRSMLQDALERMKNSLLKIN